MLASLDLGDFLAGLLPSSLTVLGTTYGSLKLKVLMGKQHAARLLC